MRMGYRVIMRIQLMEEILPHLLPMKPYEKWDKLSTSTGDGQISSSRGYHHLFDNTYVPSPQKRLPRKSSQGDVNDVSSFYDTLQRPPKAKQAAIEAELTGAITPGRYFYCLVVFAHPSEKICEPRQNGWTFIFPNFFGVKHFSKIQFETWGPKVWGENIPEPTHPNLLLMAEIPNNHRLDVWSPCK